MIKRDISRRVFVQHACCGAAVLAGSSFPALAADGAKTTLTPEQALNRLKQGNADFLADKSRKEKADNNTRRLEISKAQSPFAVLVGCSDSRVPPELLFGSGLGELFIVRNAGNTVDTVAMGSIEYGVLELGVPLIVVLGHERCGAVAAAVSVVEKNTTYPGSIGKMIEGILPAALIAKSNGNLKGDDLVDAAVRENIRRTVKSLRETETMLQEPQQKGKLKIIGARYDLDNGRVEFFE